MFVISKGVGVVTVSSSSPGSIVEYNDVTFSCKSTALPSMTIRWKKTNPVPGYYNFFFLSLPRKTTTDKVV